MKDNIIAKELNKNEGKNRYKYQSFKTRVENLKIDVSHSNKKTLEKELPEGIGTYFGESLESWKELNLTLHFKAFTREISNYCQSLPQLLYHKEKIVEILEKHLKVENSLALEPLLDLVTKFARDLELDFYPFFERIITVILPLTKHRNVETLEWTFNCIAYLFKYLLKQVTDNLCSTFKLMAPLLGKEYQKPYIQHFAAEAFAYLLRKAQDDKLTNIIRFIIDSANASPNDVYYEGLSMLFCETIKSSENKIRSKGTILLRELLDVCHQDLMRFDNAEKYPCHIIFTKTTIAILHHSKKESFVPILNLYLNRLEILIKNFDENYYNLNGGNVNGNISRMDDISEIGMVLSYIYVCLTVRKGSRINDFKSIFNIIIQLSKIRFISSTKKSNNWDFFQNQYFKTCAALITLSNFSDVLVSGKTLLDKIFEYNDVEHVLAFYLELANNNWEHYTKIMTPYIVRNTEETHNPADELLKLIQQNYDWVTEVEKFSMLDLDLESDQVPLLALISASLTILKHVTAPKQVLYDSLVSLIKNLVNCLQLSDNLFSPLLKRPVTNGSPFYILQYLLGQAIELLVETCCTSENDLSDLWDIMINDILIGYGTNEVVLRGIMKYLEFLRKQFSTDSLQKIYPHIKHNISSRTHHKRLYTLKILNLFDQFDLKPVEGNRGGNSITGLCHIFDLALHVEEVETTFSSYREKIIQLQRLGTLASTKQIPDFYSEVIPLLCLGLFTINFSAIWTEATNLLITVAQVDPKTFWSIIYNEISKFNEETIFFNPGFSEKVCDPEQERFDHWNYYNLLIKTLIEVPHIVEQHSKHNNKEDLQNKSSVQVPQNTKKKLMLFLQLFSKFKNPKAVFKSSQLQSNYLRLLILGDAKIQALALDCIFSWKHKGIAPYKDNIKNLVDETKFRDELSTFSLSKDNSTIEFAHRAEVMPIIIRILYGRMIDRKGKTSSKTGMGARRVAVLSALINCQESELRFLIDLLLEPFTDLDLGRHVPFRKQIGYLQFLDDILKQLGSYLLPFISDMFKVVLYIIHDSQKFLNTNESYQDINNNQVQKYKALRQQGIKRITGFFKLHVSFNYQIFLNAMFEDFINSRIPKLNVESTQAPSALMELFAVWSSRKEYLPFLVNYNNEVLPKIFACLSAKKVRDSVVSIVLDIIENILKICEDEMNNNTAIDENEGTQRLENALTNKVLLPHISSLLDNLEYSLLKSSQNTTLGKDAFSKREIIILSKIAAFVNNGDQARKLVDLLLPNTRKSSQIINEDIKANILQIIINFLPIIPGFIPHTELFTNYYNYISHEFQFLSSRKCRILLVKILLEFSKLDHSLIDVVKIIDDLNSYSEKRLDEPDFGKRLDAFSRINQELYKNFNTMQWLPLLHNFLFFIQDPEEFSIRNNSSFCLTKFIDSVNESINPTSDDEKLKQEQLQNLLIHVIYPSIKKGMRLSNELIRVEFLTILSYTVKKCSTSPQFSDMSCLLFDDEEANFFNNIHHIQIHRRIRALKRFSNECIAGNLTSRSLVQIFSPLISHFIFESDRISDHLLINETIAALGAIASQLPWGHYYSLLKYYMRLIPRKTALEKLKQYLTKCDNETIIIRVPIALSITKLLKALPEVSLRRNLPGLLTTICQMLRIRQQEVRDVTRGTLIKISSYLGSTYFSFIVKELKAALTKGYQLHILGYTLNSLLVDLIPNLQVGEIDDCLQPIVDIIINEVFGANAKVLRKVDDLLQKLAIGLNSNSKFDNEEMIVFCRGLVSENLEISKSSLKVKTHKSDMEINYTVQLNRNMNNPMDYFDVNSYRFVEFGLSIFLAALKRNKFNTSSEEQLKMIEPLVRIIGNAMCSKHQSINIFAIKIVCIFCKLKLKSLESDMPAIIKQTFVLIRSSDNTSTELVQNCFKLLTVIIRDCKKIEFKESHLAFIIDLIKPDIEEPQRQSTTFSLIRAIISRKFIMPEIYDLMQTISEIMVTSQAATTRDLSRQLLFQFLMDYPQGRGRLKNQINFLIKNLNYTFENGRLSVMEMLNLIFTKFSNDILMEYAELFFLELVMSLVNDESDKCGEMSSALIKLLLKKMDEQRLKNVYVLLKKWFDQLENKSLQRMSLQVYGLVIEAFGDKFKKHIPELLEMLETSLNISLELFESTTAVIESNGDDSMNIDIDIDWEVRYYALSTFTKLVKSFPYVVYSEKTKVIWSLIDKHILYPHVLIQLSSSKLLGTYFSNINPETMIMAGTNIKCDYLDRNTLKKLAIKFSDQLKNESLGKELATQIDKNNTKIDHDESNKKNENLKPTLYWLFKRLSYQVRFASLKPDDTDFQRLSIYQWFAAMATSIAPGDLVPYLIIMISPLYRFINDETIKGQEIAKRKIKRNEMKKQNRKRKNADFAKQKLRFGEGKVNDCC
ncbi:2569_t:CDS:10 [Entrophospora sp. SA101]|nr:2569_t:CDS:10 [Entrophospora sp. SA101]